MPFAIERGVTVTATARAGGRVAARALALGESDGFGLDTPEHGEGWRAFVRGTVSELRAAGHALRGATLEITGDLPQGSGLSSSAAISTALSLALLDLAGDAPPDDLRD